MVDTIYLDALETIYTTVVDVFPDHERPSDVALIQVGSGFSLFLASPLKISTRTTWWIAPHTIFPC
jgi:hypothetical protein